MDVYVIGCGGNAKVVVDICKLNNYNIVGFFDDKFNRSNEMVYHKYKIIGKISDIVQYQNINIINSIGDCNIRYKIYNTLKDLHLNWINCIHPSAYISSSAKIGYGNIICYGVIINSDTILGNFNLINTYAIIEHDCKIGHFNHFAPKSTLCGGITVGDTNLFGAGSTTIPCKTVGNSNIIGAMSAIIDNIKDNCTVVGIPGKIIKSLSN
ncbi:acetyltransferase [Tupanvirus deep ocean]|uniref:Acetyltransferase n=2 Tax=Tupanvirus TaxID=2094720 RepID=A0AC62A817_9VIRU|nr:acetyltransferase [Tupanvirus deep ocean]QKU33920.1 acetyltransferase [Tupanvirus deep ocean]